MATRRVLDFDIETVASGFADPSWVPQTCIAWAYSWVGEEHTTVEALPVASWQDRSVRHRFLAPLLEAIEEADVLTGHNIVRFDLPVLNAECMRLGHPPISPTLTQDTIKFPKSTGFKKGLDNLGILFEVDEHKMPLNWQEWQDAYGEWNLKTVKERVVSDVVMHKQLREALRAENLLQVPRFWKG